MLGLQKASEKVQLIVLWSWRVCLQSKSSCYECCADPLRIKEECSTAVRRHQCKHTQQCCQKSTFSVALHRLVMQDAMGAVFKVCPEIRIMMCVDDKELHAQATWTEEAPEAARNVHGGLEEQMDTGGVKLSSDKEGNEGTSKVLCTSRWMMKDMRNRCRKEDLELTCGAGFLEDGIGTKLVSMTSVVSARAW